MMKLVGRLFIRVYSALVCGLLLIVSAGLKLLVHEALPEVMGLVGRLVIRVYCPLINGFNEKVIVEPAVLKVMNDGREKPRQLLQLPHKLPHAALHIIQIY